MKQYKQFSEKYAKSVSKSEFIKQHEHIKDFDLGEIWDHFNPKPEKKEPVK